MDEFVKNQESSIDPGATLRREVLQLVLRRVAEMNAMGRVGVVQIDLDLTAIRPVARTKKALQTTAQEFSIDEFADPTKLPILPGYTPEAWLAFLHETELPDRYPHLPWQLDRSKRTVFAAFHSFYWTLAWLAEDEPTPGLG